MSHSRDKDLRVAKLMAERLLAQSNGSVNLRFRIRLCCDCGDGARWGEHHEMAMPREQYGKLLDKLLADHEVKNFEIEYSPNAKVSDGCGKRAHGGTDNI